MNVRTDFLPRTADPAFAGLQILVVEDHPVNRRLCGLMLRDLGCAADYAEDGSQALAMLEGKNYDLILMDCMMPSMNGFEATKAIRQNEALNSGGHRARIVAFTVNVELGEPKRCLNAGMDDFLAKPVNSSQLIKVMMEATRNRNAFNTGRGADIPEPSPALDVVRISQLCDEIDEEVVVEMVGLFLNDLSEQCALCRRGLEQELFFDLTRHAHSIKGAASTLGASALEESAAGLEQAAAQADHGWATQEMKGMMVAAEQTRSAMESWLLRGASCKA